MAPRKRKPVAEIITLSSDSESPAPASKPKSKAAAAAPAPTGGGGGGSSTRRTSPRKLASSTPKTPASHSHHARAGVDEEEGEGEEEEDADLALARKLQEEEYVAYDHAGGNGNGTGIGTGVGGSGMDWERKREGQEEEEKDLDFPPIASASRPRSSAATNKSTNAAADANDPKTLLRSESQLFLGEVNCQCGKELEANKVTCDLEKKYRTDEEQRRMIKELGTMTCAKCKKVVCCGCGDGASVDGKCCSAGRAVILYKVRSPSLPDHCSLPGSPSPVCLASQVLSSLDSIYLLDRLHKPVPASPTKPKAKKARGKPKGVGAGVGYGSGAAHAVPQPYAPGGVPYYPDEDEFDDEFGYGYDEEDEDDDFSDMMMYAQAGGGMVAVGGGIPSGPAPGSKAHTAALAKAQLDRLALESQKKLKDKSAAADLVFLNALKFVTILLPKPDANEAMVFDYLPHPTLVPLLLVSTLGELLSDLLRNDSVSEWTKRSELYFGVLAVLEGLTEWEGTLNVLFGERWEKEWSEGIGEFVNGKGDVRWSRKVVEGDAKGKKKAVGRGRKRKATSDDEDEAKSEGEIIKAQPLFSYLRRLRTQSEAFRKAAASGEFSEEDSKLIGICGDITSTEERCARTRELWMAQSKRDVGGSASEGRDDEEEVGGKGKGKAKANGNGGANGNVVEYSEEDYAVACSALAYKSVQLASDVADGKGGQTFVSHYYNKELMALASSKRHHGGFVHIVKELAVLATSLPPGIWLRVDESRIDCIKLMISGPVDTPYAGGLFEFDCFLPLTYPNTPPLVYLRTTGAGACRFNPNLYANGKVCLSLLGTWPGAPEEMWKPTSTLLQVFLSIQSMILGTSMPYFNEPGFGQPKDSPQNKTYNMNVSLATVRHAILTWTEPQFRDGIWGDVIAMHFKFNRASIKSQIKTWAAKDARMRAWVPSLNQLSGQAVLQPYRGGAIPNQPAANTASRDLLKEFDDAVERVEAWRDEAFYKTLLDRF